ncbi:MAG: hypothetical protein K8T90_13650 [Planctomycetes bacterium]|nr:hypothetical protein [Planctomycetota bacterium]
MFNVRCYGAESEIRVGRKRRSRARSPSAPDENELWILDELFMHDGVPLALFCPCHVGEALNRSAPWEDMSIDVPTDAFIALRDREWVEFRQDDKAFDPSWSRIRTAISLSLCWRCDELELVDTVVGLTPLGVAAWEREFEPDWDLYVEVVCPSEGGFHLRAHRRDLLEAVLANLGPAGVVVDSSTVSWHPPERDDLRGRRSSWIELPWRPWEPMHGVSFHAARRDEPECGEIADLFSSDIEAACPRWCSRWSHLSRWRSGALPGDG